MTAKTSKASAPAPEPAEAAPEPHKVMSFREHIMELRGRLVRITIVVVIGFFVAWEFRVPFFDFLSAPVADALADNGIYQFQAITLTESIVVYLKTAFVATLFFLSPYIFWELWAFISPGLYAREKRFILPLTAFSVAFFALGAAFAYVVLLPFLTDWLVNLSMEGGKVDVMVTLQNTYSFAFTFLLMFGLVFELPLVLFFLALWGAVSGKGLLKFWRYFVVISFIISGILTPPDPLSQIFMAVPLNVLYGFGVVVAYSVSRARASGRTDASRVALRAMALSLLGFLAIASAAFVYIAGLPQKPLYAYAPPTSAFAAGMNPKVLASEKAVLGLARGTPEVARLIDALQAAGRPLDELTEGLLLADAEGRRAVLLREDGLGALAPQLPAPAGWKVTALDDHTLAIAEGALGEALDAWEPTTPELGDEEVRLLRRLPKSGPLWVWLPPTSPARERVLGADNANELRSVGASLALGQRRQVVFDLPDWSEVGSAEPGDKIDQEARDDRADRIEARIEAARVAALSRGPRSEQDEVKAALLALGKEVEQLADAAAKARIGALLTTLSSPTPAGPDTFPALSALAPELRGVSVRREAQRITVTAELSDEGLSALFGLLTGR